MADLPNWNGATAVVIASGPSAKTTPIELAVGRAKMIAVNSSWRLVPWADVLYACDGAWWNHHNGVPDFPGRKFTSSPMACRKFGLEMFTTRGSNSGLRSMLLAQRFGADRILLVGFDMHGGHWHEPHGGVMRNPGPSEMSTWRKEMEREARRFVTKIINCTPGSALKCFPLMTLEEALDDDHQHQVRSDQPRPCAVQG